jgi:hypothetical protein
MRTRRWLTAAALALTVAGGLAGCGAGTSQAFSREITHQSRGAYGNGSSVRAATAEEQLKLNEAERARYEDLKKAAIEYRKSEGGHSE